jgi:hypothetical protein
VTHALDLALTGLPDEDLASCVHRELEECPHPEDRHRHRPRGVLRCDGCGGVIGSWLDTGAVFYASRAADGTFTIDGPA